MRRPWCKCENKGECIGCLIENKLRDRHALEEMIVQHYYGTDGLGYYRENMKQYDFNMEE